MHRRTLIPIIAVIALAAASLVPAAAAAPTLYATGSGGAGALSGLYTIDPVTGVATYVADIPDVHVYAGGLAYDPSTDTLYATGVHNATTGISRLFIIDRMTGAATAFPGMNPAFNLQFGGLAIHPVTGVLYATGTNGFQSSALFTIDKTTGAATLIGQSGGSFPDPLVMVRGLGFRGDGELFANGLYNYAFSSASHLMKVDLATGKATDIGAHGVALGLQLSSSGLAFREDGTLVSFGSIDQSTAGFYSVNTATGAATLIGSTVLATGVSGGLAFVTEPDADAEPPTVSPAPDLTVEATQPSGAFVDYPVPTAVDDRDGPVDVVCDPGPSFLFALGTTSVTCTATDVAGNTGSSSFDITVVDTTPPVITAIVPSAAVLWPPNHKMVPIAFAVVAADAVDPSVTCRIVAVASSEPVNGLGDGDAAPDWSFDGLVTQLRSERGGRGVGRVYTVTVRCTDDAGNWSDATSAVSVPKSLGR